MQWYGFFRVLLAPLALELWVISLSLYPAGTWPGVYAPVYGCFWKNFSHLVFMPAQFALGNLDTTFTSPSLPYSFAQCLARQWIHVLIELWVAFGRISSMFFVKESSDPAVDPRPALLGIFPSCSMEKCVQSMLRLP